MFSFKTQAREMATTIALQLTQGRRTTITRRELRRSRESLLSMGALFDRMALGDLPPNAGRDLMASVIRTIEVDAQFDGQLSDATTNAIQTAGEIGESLDRDWSESTKP